MFDIYSLAKPRVFKTEHGGVGGFTPSETPAPPDSVEYESATLNKHIGVMTEEEVEQSQHPESEGRVFVKMNTYIPKSINVINAASDFGGRVLQIVNNPFSATDHIYRTEFRPKQGLHNLDFTTPAETPSDNPGGDDKPMQPTT